MKPNDRTLGDYFEGANPFVVPPYQRPYEWDEPRWVDLWRDLLLLYRRSLASSQRLELNGPQHFMGTLIVQTGDWLGGRRGAQLLLVDGQQRIATLFLAEAARRDHAAFLAGIDVDPEPLVRMPRTDVPRVTLTTMDQEAFESAMRGDFVNAVPEVHGTSQTARAYRFFRFQLWRGGNLPVFRQTSHRAHPANAPHLPQGRTKHGASQQSRRIRSTSIVLHSFC